MRKRAAGFVACFFLVAFLTDLEAQVAPKEGWYTSDPAGLALESIQDPAGYEYALHVVRQGDQVRSQLFHNGQVLKTWIRTYGPSDVLVREATEKDGLVKEEFLYDAQGRPSLERIFLEQGDVEETAYEYASGRLASKTTTSGGMTISKRTYMYAPDGRLALSRDETGSESGTSAARSGGSSSWRITETGLELRSYNATGRLTSISVYVGAERLSHEARSWKDGVLERVTLETVSGSTTSMDYVLTGPALGEIALVTVTDGDTTLSTERREYDEKGRLARLETSVRGRETAVAYEYGDDDVLAATKTSVEGVPVSVVRNESSTTRVEELYDSGVIFARVRYEDGRRVLEEMIRDGIVVRTRSFP